jgi:hypothetical protein
MLKKLLAIACLMIATTAQGNECYLGEDQKKVVSLNKYNIDNVTELFAKIGISKKNHDIGKLYLPDSFELEIEDIDTIESSMRIYKFKNQHFNLYYSEWELSTYQSLIEETNDNRSSFEFISDALEYFQLDLPNYCDKRALLYYLHYTTLFPNQSAQKLSFANNEDVILLIRNDRYSFFKFLIRHDDPKKVWSVTYEKSPSN